jgi:hypothetical protein
MDIFCVFFVGRKRGAPKKKPKNERKKEKIYLLGLIGPQKNSWSGGNEGTLLTVQHILIINSAMSLPPPTPPKPAPLINNS